MAQKSAAWIKCGPWLHLVPLQIVLYANKGIVPGTGYSLKANKLLLEE